MVEKEEKNLVLTVIETAKLLRVSRGSAYEAVRLKQIPSIRIGRRILVPRAALKHLLQDGILDNLAPVNGKIDEK